MLTLRHIAAGVVASVFVIAITVDSADARRGGGGGGARAGGVGGGGGAMRAGGGARGGHANVGSRRAHVSNPIARPGVGNRPGDGAGWGNNRPGLGNPGWGNNRPGWDNAGWGRPGYGWGAAAVGAGLMYSSSYDGGYYNDASYADTPDAIAYCAQRFRSYDPSTQTYLARAGQRVRCP